MCAANETPASLLGECCPTCIEAPLNCSALCPADQTCLPIEYTVTNGSSINITVFNTTLYNSTLYNSTLYNTTLFNTTTLNLTATNLTTFNGSTIVINATNTSHINATNATTITVIPGQNSSNVSLPTNGTGATAQVICVAPVRFQLAVLRSQLLSALTCDNLQLRLRALTVYFCDQGNNYNM